MSQRGKGQKEEGLKRFGPPWNETKLQARLVSLFHVQVLLISKADFPDSAILTADFADCADNRISYLGYNLATLMVFQMGYGLSPKEMENPGSVRVTPLECNREQCRTDQQLR